MNTFEKVVHKAIHKQALNSAVRDLSEKEREMTDDLRVVNCEPQETMEGKQKDKTDIL